MIELLPHHAQLFIDHQKEPKETARDLAYGKTHRRALRQILEDILNNRQDEPISLKKGRHDIFCKFCPRRKRSYRSKKLGRILKKCDPTTEIFLDNDERVTQTLRELTGKRNPTPKEIYLASRPEWKIHQEELENLPFDYDKFFDD